MKALTIVYVHRTCLQVISKQDSFKSNIDFHLIRTGLSLHGDHIKEKDPFIQQTGLQLYQIWIFLSLTHETLAY